MAAGAILQMVILFSPIPRWLYAKMDVQDSLRRADYIVCLGGDPTRVFEAVRLLDEGYGEKIIVSNNPVASRMMRDLAVRWGAPPDKVLVDPGSWRTADHPGSIQRSCGVDPRHDTCIIVTSYVHMVRARACFTQAGYQHVIMRELRWEREFRDPRTWRSNFWIMPELLYEGAGLVTYALCGYI